jgi:O-antigen/teichoic acid export membrane protein
MDSVNQKTQDILRSSEKFFKTDMVYLAKGGSWLGLGQVFSTLIALGSALFFANVISKDLYGNYKFVLAATSILGALSLSGIGSVIIQGVAQGAEGILKDAVKTSLKWGSIIVAVSVFASAYYFINGNTVLGIVMLMAGLSLPISNAYSQYGSYLNGKKEFKLATLYNIGTQLLTTTSIIIVAYLTKNLLAMVATYFIVSTLSALIPYKQIISKFHINDTKDHSLIPLSKHLSLMSLFGTIASQMDNVLVFHYLGAINLAVFTFSKAIPDQFRGGYKILFGVAVPKYATLSGAQLRHSVEKKFLQLTLLTLLLIAVYIIAAPFIFKLLFPKYIESVFYSQIYMLGMFTIPGLGLFSNYFLLKKATRTLYKLSIMSNVATIIITFFFIYKYGAVGAVISNCVSWTVMLLLHMYYFYTDKQDIGQLGTV